MHNNPIDIGPAYASVWRASFLHTIAAPTRFFKSLAKLMSGTRDLLAVVRGVVEAAGIGPHERLVVGLSGGVDSQTLVHLLLRLRAHGVGPDLQLVHVDHGLRPHSADDARAVEQIARGWSLPLDVITVNINEWRVAQRQGVEAAARAARYAALARVAADWSTGRIAVGHNLDDQAETVLLRLARGASLDGLTGMRADSAREVWLDPAGIERTTIQLLRPLLGVRREEIEAYAAEHQLVPVVDESNDDPQFRRNALRHELMPVLERIVPGARTSLARSADLLADDADFLHELAVAAYRHSCQRLGSTIWIERDAFRSQPPAVQRRMGLLTVHALADGIELTRERVEALRAAVLSGAVASRIEIGRGLSALIDYATVLVGPSDQLELAQRQQHALPELAPGTVIDVEQSLTVAAGAHWTIVIDQPCSLPGWLLRTRLPGDRLLLPNGHHKRLQDWLVDHKVPAALRDRLPLLLHDDVVCWVAGIPTNAYEDVHSRLTARLVERSGDSRGDDEHAQAN